MSRQRIVHTVDPPAAFFLFRGQRGKTMGSDTLFVPLVDAARQARVPYGQLWQAIARGDLAAQRRGGRWVVQVEDVDRLVQQRGQERDLVGGGR
ncbi:MAG: hypothetical protein HY560_05010 [Gemmatimonadetes bacterium]|nr:hypothetical protein [Gemmatimonadota bacterium]